MKWLVAILLIVIMVVIFRNKEQISRLNRKVLELERRLELQEDIMAIHKFGGCEVHQRHTVISGNN